MFSPFVAIVSLVIGVPDINVRWTNPHKETIEVSVENPDERLGECLQSGFRVRNRYALKICASRAGIFSECRDARTIVRSLEYDAVSESYKVTSDIIGDSQEGTSFISPTKESALSELSIIKDLTLTELGATEKEVISKRPFYISVRLISDCKGEYNQTLARIGYFLSLGLIRFNETDTGWISFTLDRGP